MQRLRMIIKETGSLQRMHRALKLGLLIFVVIAVLFTVISGTYSEKVNKGLSDSLVRLHVIANSDSPGDQALKRDVRDVILSSMKGLLKDSKDIGQTSLVIRENLDRIQKVAAAEVARQGKSYDVKVFFGNFPFPTKLYGDIALPAGDYTALRVVIGKGEGANWWCVLFPPLCFVDATHGTVPDSVKTELKNNLTKEEYTLITSAGTDDEIPVKVKFKVVEFFESSKIRFTGVINKIFSVKN